MTRHERVLDYHPSVVFEQGLCRSIEWFRQRLVDSSQAVQPMPGCADTRMRREWREQAWSFMVHRNMGVGDYPRDGVALVGRDCAYRDRHGRR